MNQISQAFAGLFLLFMLFIFMLAITQLSEWLSNEKKGGSEDARNKQDLHTQDKQKEDSNIRKT